MATNILRKSRHLILLLLCVMPAYVQATQSSPSNQEKKEVNVSTASLRFLTRRLDNLSDTTQSDTLFESLCKLKSNPGTLTQEEKKDLGQYIGQERHQLGKALTSPKSSGNQTAIQQTHQALTHLLHQMQPPPRRPGELLIPANGHCLYTCIILGYLLPVVGHPNQFNERLGGMVDTKQLPITAKQLASHYNDPHYLHSDKGFQQVISGLLKKTGIKPGTWGGKAEIRKIAEKIKINIEVCYPNPKNLQQLVNDPKMTQSNWVGSPTIKVVQDKAQPREIMEEVPNNDSQYRHFRLYYSGKLPQPPPKQPQQQNQQQEQKKDDPSNPAPKETPENPKHSDKVVHTKPPLPIKKTNLPDLLKTHYKAQNEIPGLLGDKPQPLESCYIHLSMLTEEAHQVKKERFLKKKPNPDEEERKEDGPQEEDSQEDKKPDEEREWHKSLDYTILQKVQKPIKLEELWNVQVQKEDQNKEDKKEENKDKVEQPSQNKPPRHVVVTGEAGTGKSTLSQYIAYQWAQGTLWPDRFEWVLQVPLRKIRNLKGQSPHDQIAAALGIPHLQGSDLQHLLQQKGPGLLILDGYDEVAMEVDKKAQSPPGPVAKALF